MADTELWPTIHGERAALAADLAPLPDAQWATTSLCANWTVNQALGHMTATAKLTPPKFFANLVKAGFSFEKMAAAEIATETAGGPKETLRRFNEVLNFTNHPPGPSTTWLGETIVHAEDIRRPLGIKHEYPTAAAVQVANFYKGSNLLIGAKKRIAGLALRATDADWSHGTGPEVAGPIVSLVLAMTGRTAALDDLTGEGVATLRSRT
jgi:uncharacterized protein (TIGR03083 family)